MRGLALALWLVYFAVALVYRVASHRHRTGATGLAMLRTRVGSLQWAGETASVLALALGAAAPALARTVEPVAALDHALVQAAGVVVFVLSLALIAASQATMGESWRIGVDEQERTELVTGGPFAHVRNPIFTGLVAALAGNALMVPSVLALAALLLMVVSVEVQARLVEEPHLRRTHGDAYAAYARRAGRFVPGVGRLR